MEKTVQPGVYQFGVFQFDAARADLRRNGMRVRLGAQPCQILALLLANAGQVVERETIQALLWPEGTYVDFEHGMNSSVNRIREALGDKASNPVFVETVARKGYRFLASVTEVGEPTTSKVAVTQAAPAERIGVLPTEADLPRMPAKRARAIFIALQVMYICFYVGALANLGEVEDLLQAMPHSMTWFATLITSASLLVPVRAFLMSAAILHPPGFRGTYRKLWPFLLVADVLWSLSPFLLLHHINMGLALACAGLLVYSPFAQRSLVLMGATDSVA